MSHTKAVHRPHTQPAIKQMAVSGLHWQKALARAALVCLLTVAGVLVLQLAYPRGMALPHTRIGGKSFGFRSRQDIARSLNQLNGHTLQISSQEQIFKHMPGDIGLTIDGSRDAEQVVRYSWQERLIPFSLFFERREKQYVGFVVDDTKALGFAKSLAKYDKAPVNAVVKLGGKKGTEIIVEKGAVGYAYEASKVMAAIKHLGLTHEMHVSLQPKAVEPDIPERVARGAALILQRRLSTPLKVKAGRASVIFSKQTLASWTTLESDTVDGTLRIIYDRAAARKALTKLAKRVYRPATKGGAVLRDGVLIGTNSGADGRELNFKASVAATVAAAKANRPVAKAVVRSVAPLTYAVRTYTRSSKGIQALLDYWDQTHPGQFGVVMRGVKGNISASVNASTQFTSASVYKIYVAYVVYTKVNSGQVSMNAVTSTGATVSGCLESMIVQSSNACGGALGNMIGWNSNDSLLKTKGFGSTTLTMAGQLTSAQDVAKYLTFLQAGKLTHSKYDPVLLDMLGRQMWRYGIPAASPGMHVANKLGVVGAFNHDAGVVYHPKGTYVLAIMSYGSSFGSIRELAGQVAAVMNQ